MWYSESFSYPETTDKTEADNKHGDVESAGKIKLDKNEQKDQLDPKAVAENADAKEMRESAKRDQALDQDSQKLYSGAQVEKMPGGTTYSREAEKLGSVARESSENSLFEMQSAKNWTTATPEIQQGIEQNYRDLESGFDKKLNDIKAKYAEQPNPEAYAKELFEAQKQFRKDLGEIAADANGKINGIPASKDAASAKEKAEREVVAKKEQKRFDEGMRDMMTMEVQLKRMEERNREIASVMNSMELMGLAKKTTEALPSGGGEVIAAK